MTRILLFAFVLLGTFSARAALQPFSAPRIWTPSPGAPVVIGTSTANSTALVNPLTGAFYDHTVTDRITLGLLHEYGTYVSSTQNVVVQLKVKRWNTPSLTLITPDTLITLSINVNPGASTDIDLAMAEFKNAYKFYYEIYTITVNGGSTTTLPANMYIDGDIFVDRYHTFASPTSPIPFNTATLLDLDGIGSSDVRHLSWAPVAGVQEYQLEWAYINNYGDLSDIPASSLAYNFKHNSTRISTTETSYDIPLIYDKGWLVYRLRGIGVNTPNITQQITGVWNVAESGNVDALGTLYKYEITTPHENDLNWQYSATYAEQGKKKEVINYYDGSLRGRQTVTKINSDQNAIVGETIYDHQGRPAITVIPSPVPQPSGGMQESVLKYYPKYNQNPGGDAYSRTDFDVSITDPCASPTDSMTVESGSSNYYSSHNPDQTAEQAYVPRAGGYPFSQTEYTPDNTGRIRRQGGVGPEFQLGEHDTRYLYGQPEQEELDRLFGSEVGIYKHYRKNVVIDAHGQASIIYLDQEGRTVATALAGENPLNVSGIESEGADATSLLINLLNPGSNTVNADGTARTISKQLVVAAASNFIFDYGLSIDPLTDPCLPGFCIDCVYDLQLMVINECGDTLSPTDVADSLTGVFTFNEESGEHEFHALCESPEAFEIEHDFSIYLTPGNYSLIKILTVNEEARQAYLDLWHDTTVNACMKTLYDFELEALADVDTSGCHIDCEECLDELGSIELFVGSGQGTADDYYARKEDCEKLCNGGTMSLCEIAYTLLRSDVSPGGQYAQHTNTSTNVFNPGAFPLSLLSTSNHLSANIDGAGIPDGTAHWRLPHFIDENGVSHYEYREESGERSRITVTFDGTNWEPAVLNTLNIMTDPVTGDQYIYPENLASVSDFVFRFKYSWSESLVLYHPEYCYYESCIKYDEPQQPTAAYTSESFDQLLLASTTVAAATTNGFLQPVFGGYDITPNLFTPSSITTTSPPWDPFGYYQANYATTSCPDYAQMFMDMVADYKVINGVHYSMAEVAAVTARYGPILGATPTDPDLFDFGNTSPSWVTTEMLENEWSYFQSFYRSAKQQFQRQREHCMAINECEAYNGCIGDDEYSPVGEGMVVLNSGIPAFLSSPYFDQHQPCGVAHKNLYIEKVRRFGDPTDGPIQNANEAAYHVYLETGQCPVAYSLQTLLHQMSQENKLDDSGIDMTNYSPFVSLFIAANNFYNPSAIPALTYNVTSSSSTTLTADWVDGSSAVYATLTLNLPVTPPLTWDDLDGIYALVASTVTPGDFTATAMYFDGTANAYIDISGSITTFNIANCQFEQECTSNQLAKDLTVLLNTAVVSGDLVSTTPVPVYLSPYYEVMTQIISGATYPYDQWEYLPTTHQFHLYNSYGTVTDGLYISLNSATPSSFNWANLGTVESFELIVSSELNTFTVVAHLPGSVTVTFDGDVVRMVNGNPIGLRLGDCELPTPIACQTTNHDLFSNIEDVLYDVLINQPFTGPGVNLFESAEMSATLGSYLPGNSSTSAYTHYTSGGVHTGTLTFDLLGSGCDIVLQHKDNASPSLSLVNLTLMSEFTLTGTQNADGTYSSFYFIGTFDVSGTPYTDTVFGTTCLPMKACVTCPENPIVFNETPEEPRGLFGKLFANKDNEGMQTKAEPIEETEGCEKEYNDYVKCIDTYNMWARTEGYFTISDVLSYEDFVAAGYCDCDSLCKVLDQIMFGKERPRTEGEFLAMIDMETLCGDTKEGCEATYQQYLDCIENYNAWATAERSFLFEQTADYAAFVDKGYCFCVDEFCARLNTLMTKLKEVHSSQELHDYLAFKSFCTSKPPCTPEVSTGGPVISPEIDIVDNCVELAIGQALFEAQLNYENYLDSIDNVLINRYNQHCMANVHEDFTYLYDDKMYHFTLYYYDQAGNLIKTIPPEGVEKLNFVANPLLASQIQSDRANGTKTVYTTHRLASRYEYNSLNQLVAQSTPDADLMNIFELTLPNGLPANLVVNKIQMVNASRGYLGGHVVTANAPSGQRGYLFRTDDGGATWNEVSNVAATDLKKVQMLSATLGFAIGEAGMVLRTVDGGMNWDMVYTWATTGDGMIKNLNDLYFIPDGANYKGFIVGEGNAVILVTVVSNIPSFTVSTSGLPAVATNSVTGVTSDGSLFFITVNATSGGLTTGTVYSCPVTGPTYPWTEHTSVGAEALYAVQFIPGGSEAYAAGIDGRLYKNVNPSVSTNKWQLIPTNVAYPIKSLRFFNATQGVALMETAASTLSLMRTADGGQNWIKVSDGNFNNLSLTATGGVALAVGKAGRIEALTASADPTAEGIVIDPSNPALEWTAGWAEKSGSGASEVLRIVVAASNKTLHATDNGYVMDPVWQSTGVIAGLSGQNVAQIEAKTISTGGNPIVGVLRTANNKLYSMSRLPASTPVFNASITNISGSHDFKAMTLDNALTRVLVFNNSAFGFRYIPLTTGTLVASTVTGTASSSQYSAMTFNSTQLLATVDDGKIHTYVFPTSTTHSALVDHTEKVAAAALYDIEYSNVGSALYLATGADGQYYKKTSGTPATKWQIINTGVNEAVNVSRTTTSGTYIAGTNGLFRYGTVTGNTLTSQSALLTTGLTAEQGLAGVTLHDIAFRGTRMYAVGTAGNVLYSSDFAVVAFSPLQQAGVNLYGVAFKTGANQAYAVGKGARIHELSAATFIVKKQVYTESVKDIHFVDGNNGTVYASTAGNFILRTTQDGGLTWNVVKPTTNQGPTDVIGKLWTLSGQYTLVFGAATNQFKVVNNVLTSAGFAGMGTVTAAAMKPGTNVLYTASSTKVHSIVLNGSGSSYTLTPTLVLTHSQTVADMHVFENGDYALAGGTTFRYYKNTTNAVVFTSTLPGTIRDIHFHDRINGVIVGDNTGYYRTSGQTFDAFNYLTGTGWTTATEVTSADPYFVTSASYTDIKTIAFSTPANGIFGGNYKGLYPNLSNPVKCYARLVYNPVDRYTARFFYDKLGRLVVSQNSRQFAASPKKFSYMRYDDLGRVIEAGEKADNVSVDPFKSIFGTQVGGYFNPKTIDDQNLDDWLDGSGARTEVTHTFYDQTVIGGLPSDFPVDATTQRKRITHITYEEAEDGIDDKYDHATHYNYDIHGNVKNVLQDNRKMSVDYPTLAAHRYKRVDYTYDLISGNVNRVSVETGKRDQWHHAYNYDADNRITDAYTSKETPLLPATSTTAALDAEVTLNQKWERDAHYSYYDHGPLARTELGEHQLQGMDYVYNLQGWNKGVNSINLRENTDPGNDNGSGVNSIFAKDVMAYSLHYFNGDYAAINAAKNGTASFETVMTGGDMLANSAEQFNGNIRAMQTTITDPSNQSAKPLGNAYRYDQLSRLVESRSFDGLNLSSNTWPTASTYDDMYFNSFQYDAVGNIERQKRYDENGDPIDDLRYTYRTDLLTGNLMRNQLLHINDAVNPGSYGDDIDDQDVTPAANNYVYDQEGRLIHDQQEQIEKIIWRIDGKIKEVIRINPSSVQREKLKFDYDAMGHRIAKHVYDYTTGLLKKSTYYILDATGKAMNTYEYTIVSSTAHYDLAERQIYGSDRLGMSTVKVDMLAGSFTSNPVQHDRGLKLYEMENHLGNVLTVVRDKVKPLDANSDTHVDGHQVFIFTATDYSPFGAVLYGRDYGTTEYRYGFSGKEKDDELKLEKNSYDFGARIYDPRVGRWLSVDPLAGEYPATSPYVYVANSPLKFVDPDGRLLVVAGSEAQAFVDMVSGFLKNMTVTMDETGRVCYTLNENASVENLTEFEKTLVGTIDAVKIIQVNTVASSDKVLVDADQRDGGNNEVDMSDLKLFKTPNQDLSKFAEALIGHFLEERLSDAATYDEAHKAGIAKEMAILQEAYPGITARSEHLDEGKIDNKAGQIKGKIISFNKLLDYGSSNANHTNGIWFKYESKVSGPPPNSQSPIGVCTTYDVLNFLYPGRVLKEDVQTDIK